MICDNIKHIKKQIKELSLPTKKSFFDVQNFISLKVQFIYVSKDWQQIIWKVSCEHINWEACEKEMCAQKVFRCFYGKML